MLLNDFFTYKVIDKAEGVWTLELTFNASHDIYKGHFPGLPVTPGICQVQMVQEIISNELNEAYRLKSARDIKFLNFIDPSKTPGLQLQLTIKQKEEETLAVSALMKNDEVNFLKMRSVFSK
ncbi:hypothetical protein [Plebeiibacterium marinum]|uniref:ApeI dehydratase-like domain-containing protein n=1 Tax=Plebeiibacterium marinum TaxID=2992111 RepID=A0AAE3MED0_9BACT|nr:hypothetical protein [Plebeiobacterium marinum]MCW3806055.1 hypothetical protein [Plebeiobacterium marinum]